MNSHLSRMGWSTPKTPSEVARGSQPLRCWVVMVDVSGSMEYSMGKSRRSRLDAAADAVVELAGAAFRAGPVELHLASFADSVQQCWSPKDLRSVGSVRSAVSQLAAEGETNISSALIWARDALYRAGPAELLLLSDGCANAGDDPRRWADEIKSGGDRTIHTVGIGARRSDVDEGLLMRIASPGPHGLPLYRFIMDPEALIEHFHDLGTGLTE